MKKPWPLLAAVTRLKVTQQPLADCLELLPQQAHNEGLRLLQVQQPQHIRVHQGQRRGRQHLQGPTSPFETTKALDGDGHAVTLQPLDHSDDPHTAHL